jgi:hypothetical protein
MVRKTLDAHEDVKERAAAIIALIDDLGLEPPPEVEPLPEIEENDVNLVTWLALVPNEVGDDSPRSPHASGRHG